MLLRELRIELGQRFLFCFYVFEACPSGENWPERGVRVGRTGLRGVSEWGEMAGDGESRSMWASQREVYIQQWNPDHWT